MSSKELMVILQVLWLIELNDQEQFQGERDRELVFEKLFQVQAEVVQNSKINCLSKLLSLLNSYFCYSMPKKMPGTLNW